MAARLTVNGGPFGAPARFRGDHESADKQQAVLYSNRLAL
jgi:hypothetical protein